jgi:hypothetical protein
LVCAAGYSHNGGVDPTCFLGNYFGSTSTCVAATCAALSEQSVSSNCGVATTGSASRGATEADRPERSTQDVRDRAVDIEVREQSE